MGQTGLPTSASRVEGQPKAERLLPSSAFGPLQGSGDARRPCFLSCHCLQCADVWWCPRPALWVSRHL